jgi:hypothetical protein
MSAQDYEKGSVGKDIHDTHNKADSYKINGAANLNLSYTPLFLAPLYL